MTRTIAICYSPVNSNLRVPTFSSLLCNEGMDAKRARKANLLDLEQKHGTLESLSKRTKTPAAYLSEIKNGTRNMGDKVARRFEKELKLGDGWMDTRNRVSTQGTLAAPALLKDFEGLPPVIQEHISQKTRELRELFDKIKPELRHMIIAPPQDPVRYAEWEANIRALIASERR